MISDSFIDAILISLLLVLVTKELAGEHPSLAANRMARYATIIAVFLGITFIIIVIQEISLILFS